MLVVLVKAQKEKRAQIGKGKKQKVIYFRWKTKCISTEKLPDQVAGKSRRRVEEKEGGGRVKRKSGDV